jgi:hypothetical protein
VSVRTPRRFPGAESQTPDRRPCAETSNMQDAMAGDPTGVVTTWASSLCGRRIGPWQVRWQGLGARSPCSCFARSGHARERPRRSTAEARGRLANCLSLDENRGWARWCRG